MANKQTLPNMVDTKKTFVQGQSSPKLPSFDYRSGMRDIAGAMEQTNDFLNEYQKMKFEQFQAGLQNIELQQIHEMQDATDPCQLEEINKKYEKAYASQYKNDFWGDSYYQSRYYENWKARHTENQQKVYFQKQHDFSAIQATATLNELSNTIALTNSPEEVYSLLRNGEAMLANSKHLTAQDKFKLMSDFYKQSVGNLYSSNPNKAVAWLDYAGNAYDKYGVNSEEIRTKANDWNIEQANKLYTLQQRERTLLKQQYEDEYNAFLQGYNSGKYSESDVLEALNKSGNNKGYNDFYKLINSSETQSIDFDVVDSFRNNITNAKTSQEVNEMFLKALKTNANAKTVTRLSQEAKAKISTFPDKGEQVDYDLAFKAGNAKTKEEALKILVQHNANSSTRTLGIQFFEARKSDKTTAKEEKKDKSSTIKSSFQESIDSLWHNNYNNEEVSQLKIDINTNPDLTPEHRAELIEKLEETLETRHNKQVEENKKLQEKENEKDQKLSQHETFVSYNNPTLLKSLSFNEIDKMVTDGSITQEQGKLLYDNKLGIIKADIALTAHNGEIYHPEDISSLNIKDSDKESLIKTAQENNAKIYSQRYIEKKENLIQDTLSNPTKYESNVNELVRLARTNNMNIEEELKDFNDRVSFNAENTGLQNAISIFTDSYGYVDENDNQQKMLFTNSREAFIRQYKESNNKSMFNTPYIKDLANQARVKDNKTIELDFTGDNLELAKGFYNENFVQEDGRLKYKGTDLEESLRFYDLFSRLSKDKSISDTDRNKFDTAKSVLNVKIDNELDSFISDNQHILGYMYSNMKQYIPEFMTNIGFYSRVNQYLRLNGFNPLDSTPDNVGKLSQIWQAVLFDMYSPYVTSDGIMINNKIYPKDIVDNWGKFSIDVGRPL